MVEYDVGITHRHCVKLMIWMKEKEEREKKNHLYKFRIWANGSYCHK